MPKIMIPDGFGGWIGLPTAKGDKGDPGSYTFDTVPLSGSTNPVTSGGIYTALSGKQNLLTFDTAPASGSANPVTSGGVYSALTSVAAGNASIVTGTYTGTATSQGDDNTHFANLGYKPKAVIIMNTSDTTNFYCCICCISGTDVIGILPGKGIIPGGDGDVTDTGFTLLHYVSGDTDNQMNTGGSTYRYIIFK